MPWRVLVIDDDRAIARLLGLLLREAGMDVDLAYDGGQGLAAARAATPGVILLDVRMPVMDGFEVHRELKQDPKLAGVPVVFLSANAQESVMHKALEGGARLFLPKPFDPRELIAVVRGVLGATNPQCRASQSGHVATGPG